MAFNPEDFQFEAITAPQYIKPIIEWDAIHRVIVLRERSDADDAENGYKYYATPLSPQVNTNLIDNLPDKWSHPNDKIISFSLYEDGEYHLEKEKIKFDFKTKKSKLIRYEYKDLQLGEVQEIFDILKAAIQIDVTDKQIIRTKAIVDIASHAAYIDQINQETVDIKDRLLKGSDWSQLADATESFDNELAMWTTYRAWLRENVKGPDDFADLLEYLLYEDDFKWPIDPVQFRFIGQEKDRLSDEAKAADYLSHPDHFTKTLELAGARSIESVYGSVKTAVEIERRLARDTDGIPFNKKLWDTVEKYKLNTGLENINLNNLNIQE